jgi:hypothetical protein
MGQQSMDKPPTKAKRIAEAEEMPGPRQEEPAPVVAIAGARVMRPVPRRDGSLAWQKLRGRPSEGAELVNLTRWAIAVCDADPLEVVKTVIAHLPESTLAKCDDAGKDPVEISRKVARLLPDQDLRSAMTDRRLDCFDANPDVEEISEDRWRGENIDLHKLAADMERVDQANLDLLHEPQWREIPKEVLRAILRELGRPRTDNLTRPRKTWD